MMFHSQLRVLACLPLVAILMLSCVVCGCKDSIFVMATDEYFDSIGADSVISTYKEMVEDSDEYPKPFRMHCKLHYIKACCEKQIDPKFGNEDIKELIDFYERSTQMHLSHEAFASIGNVYAYYGDAKKAAVFL